MAEREQVAAFVAKGLNDCEISRRTGIPRSTVRDWRARPEPTKWVSRSVAPALEELPAAEYAYLLGIYLGDGYVAPPVRGVRQLRIYLDDRYRSVIEECVLVIEAIFPRQRAHVHHHATHKMCLVTLYSSHWELLLPQHGPGMKHTRRIVLADWQREIIEREPGQFLRGLIHSDGWRGVNRVRSPAGKEYVYSQYQFCNKSDDILGLFCWACDLIGVSWRRMRRDTISVARRDSVAILDEFVGPKR